MNSLTLFDATTWTHEQLVQIIREQVAENYPLTDNLRTAVYYSPEGMTAKEFVAAAVEAGIHPSTARIQYNRARKELAEDREVGRISLWTFT